MGHPSLKNLSERHWGTVKVTVQRTHRHLNRQPNVIWATRLEDFQSLRAKHSLFFLAETLMIAVVGIQTEPQYADPRSTELLFTRKFAEWMLMERRDSRALWGHPNRHRRLDLRLTRELTEWSRFADWQGFRGDDLVHVRFAEQQS